MAWRTGVVARFTGEADVSFRDIPYCRFNRRHGNIRDTSQEMKRRSKHEAINTPLSA